jgi:hypothetical protein
MLFDEAEDDRPTMVASATSLSLLKEMKEAAN